MKLALAFLAGSLFSALAVVLAGGRPANMLFLGAALALASLAALVYLAGLRRVARLLNAFMDVMDGPQRKHPKLRIVSGKNKNPYGWVKPSAKQRDRDFANDLEFMKEEMSDTTGRVQ